MGRTVSVWGYNSRQPRQVRKVSTCGYPWVVTNHPAGPQSFSTWAEAMRYATSPYLMMNSAAKRAVQFGGEMAALTHDEMTKLLFPFGASKWLHGDGTA